MIIERTFISPDAGASGNPFAYVLPTSAAIVWRTSAGNFGHAEMSRAKSASVAVGISESGFGAPVCPPLADD